MRSSSSLFHPSSLFLYAFVQPSGTSSESFIFTILLSL